VPVEGGRRGGDKRVGESMDIGSCSCLRCGIGTGAAERGLVAAGAASILRGFDRRGGGNSGFSFPSASCISFADLNEAGDSGSFSLCIEVEVRR
jgi:hypothetical protein